MCEGRADGEGRVFLVSTGCGDTGVDLEAFTGWR
jgi:hypothetical protein